MILLRKAVVLEVEVEGSQAQPQKFWLAENLEAKIAPQSLSGKFGEIRAKSFLPQKFASYTSGAQTFWLVGHICFSETLRGPQELIISIEIL